MKSGISYAGPTCGDLIFGIGIDLEKLGRALGCDVATLARALAQRDVTFRTEGDGARRIPLVVEETTDHRTFVVNVEIGGNSRPGVH